MPSDFDRYEKAIQLTSDGLDYALGHTNTYDMFRDYLHRHGAEPDSELYNRAIELYWELYEYSEESLRWVSSR